MIYKTFGSYKTLVSAYGGSKEEDTKDLEQRKESFDKIDKILEDLPSLPPDKNDIMIMESKIENIDFKLTQLKNELDNYKNNRVYNIIINYIKYINQLKQSITEDHKKFIMNTSLGFFIGIGTSIFFKLNI
jgi:SMC interacting uncharacterized protein involved in chromosome segregation